MDNKIQCQNCGEWIDGEAQFCPNCGAFAKRSFRQDPNKHYCVFCTTPFSKAILFFKKVGILRGTERGEEDGSHHYC